MYTHEREVRSTKSLCFSNKNHAVKGMDTEMKQNVCYKSLKEFWVKINAKFQLAEMPVEFAQK